MHGTRAIQTFIEKLAQNVLASPGDNQLHHDSLMRVITQLQSDIVELTMDMHSNHVIQSFLMIFKASDLPSGQNNKGAESSAQYTQFIFDACMFNCVEIGKHKHGCCVMQRCLEKGTLEQKLKLADYIIIHMAYLIEDPYGNYLV